MKGKWKSCYKIISAVIISGVILATSSSSINAENEPKTEKNAENSLVRKIEAGDLEYTEEYKKWLSLPEKEKQKYIEPNHFGTPYEPKMQEYEKLREVTQESSFDLREHIDITVKNQMQTQSCWTFPLISEVETNISLTRGYKSPIFSARHMEYATSKTFLDKTNPWGYNREVGDGGNSTMGLSYYTSGFGPVLEKDMPFEDSEEKIELAEIYRPVGQKIEKYIEFPSIYKEIRRGSTIYKDNKGNTLTLEQVEDIRNQMKQHIKTYGGISANTNSSATQYFNDETSINSTAYYCNNNDIMVDHLVTIVGWDDDYPKENFNSNCRPTKDGAWLVLNSYGKGFNEGYYYISYEDVMVERQNTGIITVSDRDYENLYQYDLLASSVNYKPKIEDSDEEVKQSYAAVRYARREEQREYLKEVGITGVGGTHTVDIYVDTTGQLDLENAKLVASNVTLKDGYQTIKLSRPVTLTEDIFSVIVKYKKSSQITIALEANLTASGIGGSTKWDTATANDYEGYISITGEDGTWQDITDIIETSSFCIKAFTTLDDIQGPEITFEPNGNTTYERRQESIVTITDENYVNESTLRFAWKKGEGRPEDTEFEDWFPNGATIYLEGATGDDWYLWIMAKDNLGNQTYKRSEAFYLDNTPPTVPIITSNAENNVYTKDNVTVTIGESLALSGISKYEYTLNGGATWQDYNGSIVFDKSGIYRIRARATGGTGILGEESEEYIVKIDKDAPVIKGIEEGKTYRIATPTITDDTEMTPTLIKDGREIPYSINNENKGDTISQTGRYSLTVTDEVGNTVTVNFVIDADPPEVTFTPNGNKTYAKTQSTKVTITDANEIETSSLKYVWAQNVTIVTEKLFEKDAKTFTNGDTITKNEGDGEYTLLIMAKDILGNIALVKSDNFLIDTSIPTAPTIHSGIGNGGVTNQTIKITIDGSICPSGVKKYQYSLDNGRNWIDIQEGEEITLSETKTHTIIARAINNLDTIGEQTEEYTVTINKNVPLITFTPNGNDIYKKEQSTKVDVTHTNELNQESFKYVWSQSETAPNDAEFVEDFYFEQNLRKNAGSGTWYVWAKASDTLGNTAIARSEAFNLDNDKPNKPEIKSNAPNNEAFGEIAKVTLSGSNSPSGIKKYKYSLDNKVIWTDIAENEEIQFNQDGTYQIYACAVNNVGTTGEIAGPYTIKIDTTSPKITGIEEGGIYKEALPVIEDDSDVTIKLIKNGIEIAYNQGDKITQDGNYTITATDALGHETTVNFKIDAKGPQITFEPNGNDNYETMQSTKITVTDENGVDESTLRYKWTQSVQVLTEETFMEDSVEFTNGDTIIKNTGSGDNWYLWVLAKDMKGNMSLVKTKRFCLDNETPTAPTITSQVQNGGLSREDVRVSISGSDSPSGIAKYQYSLDNGVNWKDMRVGEDFIADKTGTYSIKARAVNNVGTIGQESSIYEVNVDKEGAIITFTPNGNINYAKTQSTKVDVDTINNVQELKYLWTTKDKNVLEQEFENTFSKGQTLEKNTESGTWYLWVLVKDENIARSSNNTKIVRSNAFMLDNEIPKAPTVSLNAEENSSIDTTLEITIEGSNSPSGIAKYQYSLDDGATWQDSQIGQKVKITSAGNYKIKARAVNNVGTVGEETRKYEITINKTTLSVAFVPKSNENYGKEQSTQIIIGTENNIRTLKYLWTQKQEDVQESEITQDCANKQTIVKSTESGAWYLWVLVEDDKGNKMIERSGKFNLDNEIPTAPTINKQEEEGGEKIIIDISGSNSLSGIAKYQYSLNDGITWNDLQVGEKLILTEKGDYSLKARAVNNVGTAGAQSDTQEISIKTRIPTITFTPDGKEIYQNTQTTKIRVSSNYEMKEESLKYIWSTKEEGITEEDFEKVEDLYTYGETLSKNTESGIWYIWAYAENTNGDTKIQRSKAFYLDNDKPIIEGVEEGQTYKKEVTPIIKDITSKVSKDIMKDGKPYEYTEGDSLKEDGVYQITAIDEAGNITSISFTVQLKEDDTIGPMVNFSPNGNKKYSRTQSTKVTVEDESGVKEESLKYLWTNTKETPKEEDFIKTFKNGDTITNDKDTGEMYLWIYAEDNEGNKSILRSNEFMLDNTRPTKPDISSNVDNGGTTDKEVIIKIEGGKAESDTHYEYSTDGGKTWQKVDGDTIKIKQEGKTEIIITAVNETGLRSEEVKHSFTIKKQENKKPVDNTVAKDPIPQTGIKPTIIITITFLFGIAIFSLIKFNKLEERRK